jgi:hypothetical protein
MLKLGRLLLKCSIVLLECSFDFLLRITPRLQKRPEILPCASPKYLQDCVPSFLLLLDRISIDGLFLAPAPLLSNYVVQIVAFLQRVASPD